MAVIGRLGGAVRIVENVGKPGLTRELHNDWAAWNVGVKSEYSTDVKGNMMLLISSRLGNQRGLYIRGSGERIFYRFVPSEGVVRF